LGKFPAEQEDYTFRLSGQLKFASPHAFIFGYCNLTSLEPQTKGRVGADRLMSLLKKTSSAVRGAVMSWTVALRW
jgi:hypothetical protein